VMATVSTLAHHLRRHGAKSTISHASLLHILSTLAEHQGDSIFQQTFLS
jgi:hypothetical protein